MESIPLAGHVAVLRDESGRLTLDDVMSTPVSERFAVADTARFNNRLSEDAYWYRIRLRSTAPPESPPAEWTLDIQFPLLDYVDVHVSRGDGRTDTILTGDLRQPPPEQIPHRTFAIPVRIAAAEEATLYIRIRTQGRNQVPLSLLSRAEFDRERTRFYVWSGSFHGIMLAMILYNFLIWVWTRERSYAWYTLWLTSFLLTGFTVSGYARNFGNALSAAAPAWINASTILVPTASILLAVLFGRDFMDTRLRAPRVHRFTTLLVLAGALTMALYPVISFRISVQITMVIGVLSMGTLLGAGVHLAIQGMRAARFYLLAWGAMIAAIVFFILQGLGVSEPSIFAQVLPPVATCLSVILFSLALADRINLDRRERERLARLKQFFAPQVAEAILQEGGQALLAPKRREVTVLFTDLRGFTAFAAQSEPEDVVRVLREYHEAVAAACEKHHGNVEQFAGDSVMVFFNAPVELPGHERCAVQMAFELRAAFAALTQTWRMRGYELGVGMGVASGYATVGAVGAKGRMGYSCTGTVTNLAARLCAQAQDGQVLISKTFLARIEGLAASEDLGERELKGIPKPVPVCNLTQLNMAGAVA